MTDEVEDNTEFENAFNAEAEKRDAVQADNLPDDLPAETNIGAGGEAGEQLNAADTSDGGDPKAGAGEDKDESAGKEQPFEGWPQEAIDRYKSQLEQNTQLQHRLDSDSGRVRAFQIKVDGLEKQINTIQAGSDKDQPTDKQIQDAMSGDDEGWSSFSEDYPEVAAAIDKRFEKQQANIDNTLAPVIERQQQDDSAKAATAAEESYGEVAETFPTWQDEVQKQEYRDWYATQSPGTKALGESDDTRDASLLIGLYDDYRVTNGKPTMRADPESDTGVKNKADELALRRTRQLEDGAAIPSKSARVDPDAESEGGFEAAFNVYAARQDAKRQ